MFEKRVQMLVCACMKLAKNGPAGHLPVRKDKGREVAEGARVRAELGHLP